MESGNKARSPLSLGIKVAYDLRRDGEPELIYKHRLDHMSGQNWSSLNVEEFCLVVSLENTNGFGKVNDCISNRVQIRRVMRVVYLTVQQCCLLLDILCTFLDCNDD